MNENSLLVTESLETIARDHGMPEKDVKTFASNNFMTWDYMTKTWVMLAYDLKVESVASLVMAVAKEDVCRAVKTASVMADDLVKWMSCHSSDTALPSPYTGLNPRHVLTFLKFPKKTSLTGASWLEVEARTKFWKSMDQNIRWSDNPDAILPSYTDRFTNPWFYSTMLPYLKRVMSVFFPDHLIKDEQSFERTINPFKFSNGAVQDACTNPICKYFATILNRTNGMPLIKLSVDPVMHRNFPYDELIGTELFNQYLESYPPEFQRWHQKHFSGYKDDRNHLIVTTPNPYAVKPMTVPKQMTSVRIIAPEDAAHNRKQLAFADRLCSYWERLGLRATKNSSANKPPIFLDTRQDIQRELCKSAAADGYATIDESAFSDTVRRDLIRLFDNPTLDFMLTCMPTHIKWGSVTRRCEMVGTMGSPCTFPTEMAVAAAGAIWSCRYAYLMGAVGSRPYVVGDVTVVGDDVRLPQWAAPTFIDWLYSMSMIPNESKSFVSGHYFESCGAEYWDDVDVSPIATWPRGIRLIPNTGKLNPYSVAEYDAFESTFKSPISAAADLANRLYDYGCISASETLIDYVEEASGETILRDARCEDGTVHGLTYPFFFDVLEADDYRKIRRSLDWEKSPSDRRVLSTISVVWEKSEPKRSCWCTGLDDTVYGAFVERYLYESFLCNGPQFRDELDRLLRVSSSNDDTRDFIRMKPIHRVKDAVK